MRSMLLLSLLVCTCLSSVNAGNPWEELLKKMEEDMVAIAPLNVLIGDQTGLLANITLGEFKSQETFTPIWSATKLLSGAVFFALDAEGVLPLDKHASDYFDWWSASGVDKRSKVTVRHLLNFTSGFGDTECIMAPTAKFEDCTKEIYNQKFNADQFGHANYQEAHLHIAQTIALKLTGAASWGDLWYDKVGKPAGLPKDNYYKFPSPSHPGGGSGMTISSDGYATVLAAFHESLYSKDKPTKPLKMGEGMDYGNRFWGFGNAFNPENPGQSYSYTTWRMGAEAWIHSLGCRGWLPMIFPSTSEGPGWWMQIAREGAAPVCLGSIRTMGRTETAIDAILKALKDHRDGTYSTPFQAVCPHVKCVREDAVAKKYCECSSMDPLQCGVGDLCTKQGYLTAGACTPPHTTFMFEIFEICKCSEPKDSNALPGDMCNITLHKDANIAQSTTTTLHKDANALPSEGAAMGQNTNTTVAPAASHAVTLPAHLPWMLLLTLLLFTV